MLASQCNITTCHDMSHTCHMRHICMPGVTCHMRHICMPGVQIIKKYFCSHNNLLNATFQSHPIKLGCCNTITKCLIVTTINPIWCSHPVHSGKKTFTICSLKSKENIIFAQNFILKQNTNQATCCLDCQSSIFSLSLGLDTLFFLQSILTLIV